MANNVIADHDRAWVEAYELSPVSITIDGISVDAIYPETNETTMSRDENGSLDKISEQEITIRKTDAPTMNAQTSVIIDSVTYRIISYRNAGRKAITLTLESP